MGSEKWKGNEFRMDDGTRLGGSWGERDERDGWGEGACDESTGDVNGAWGESACDGSDSDASALISVFVGAEHRLNATRLGV